MLLKKIVIAVDGYSSCGKSTLAKDLASVLSYIYIDSGAMYRAVTLYFINNKVKFNDKDELQNALNNISIEFKNSIDGKCSTYLNGKDVEAEIRQMEVSSKVSEVAAISEVRRKLVQEQRKMGAEKGIVMDGRDIGTVVFPNAEIKLFLTADEDIRVDRRFNELKSKGVEITRDEVRENLKHRDYIDSTREDSPLMKAKDAITLNNSKLDRKEQLNEALKIIKTYVHQ